MLQGLRHKNKCRGIAIDALMGEESNLFWILKETGSQGRVWRIGMMCSCFCALIRILAALFLNVLAFKKSCYGSWWELRCSSPAWRRQRRGWVSLRQIGWGWNGVWQCSWGGKRMTCMFDVVLECQVRVQLRTKVGNGRWKGNVLSRKGDGGHREWLDLMLCVNKYGFSLGAV